MCIPLMQWIHFWNVILSAEKTAHQTTRSEFLNLPVVNFPWSWSGSSQVHEYACILFSPAFSCCPFGLVKWRSAVHVPWNVDNVTRFRFLNYIPRHFVHQQDFIRLLEFHQIPRTLLIIYLASYFQEIICPTN